MKIETKGIRENHFNPFKFEITVNSFNELCILREMVGNYSYNELFEQIKTEHPNITKIETDNTLDCLFNAFNFEYKKRLK